MGHGLCWMRAYSMKSQFTIASDQRLKFRGVLTKESVVHRKHISVYNNSKRFLIKLFRWNIHVPLHCGDRNSLKQRIVDCTSEEGKPLALWTRQWWPHTLHWEGSKLESRGQNSCRGLRGSTAAPEPVECGQQQKSFLFWRLWSGVNPLLLLCVVRGFLLRNGAITAVCLYGKKLLFSGVRRFDSWPDKKFICSERWKKEKERTRALISVEAAVPWLWGPVVNGNNDLKQPRGRERGKDLPPAWARIQEAKTEMTSGVTTSRRCPKFPLCCWVGKNSCVRRHNLRPLCPLLSPMVTLCPFWFSNNKTPFFL